MRKFYCFECGELCRHAWLYPITCVLIGIVTGYLSGCTMKAGPVTGPPVLYCKDTRDGELFSFHIENVSNPVYRLTGGGCFDVIDDSGNNRHFCSEHEAYIKCRETTYENQSD